MICNVTRGVSFRHRLMAAAAVSLLATSAWAQSSAPPPAGDPTAPQTDEPTQVDEIVVTGSYIRGTPENAALPVDVIGAEELSRRGNPTVLDLIKSLPTVNGALGDSNAFDSRSAQTVGSGSINLRGLGAERTLVLLNGRRLAPDPLAGNAGGIVDTNLIPAAAIARVEILKDGAAATYGSDAIGGVVNFITRRNMDGLDLAADYRYIPGSDGDYTISTAWGRSFGDLDLLLTAGYQHRSELANVERDFADVTYLENPQGGYTAAGNPGTYVPLGATGSPVAGPQRDVACVPLGGFAGLSGTTPVCYERAGALFGNLVEDQDAYQVYGSANYQISDTVHAHAEALFARTDAPHWVTSPSQALAQTPTIEAAGSAALAGRYVVPVSNPGYAAYVGANPGVFPATTAGVQLAAYRPFFMGGNPLFGNGGGRSSTEHESRRISGGLDGTFSNGVGFDVALTYSENTVRTEFYDVLVDRFQLALRGLGGPNCDSAPATPGIQGSAGVGGCQYFNPFSNAIEQSATGAVNAQYNPAVGNDPDLIRWFYVPSVIDYKTTLFVADAVLTGDTPLHLAGGAVAWALGAQFRRDGYTLQPNDISNQLVTPCLATPDFGVTNCATQSGPFGINTPSVPVDLSRQVYAVFGELQIPLTDTLNAQIAARYEDYGGDIGSTFDPKVSVKWDVTDWLALRGSYGTTFRGPPITATTGNGTPSLQSVRGVFRAVTTRGAADLQPESATTSNFGVLVSAGGFRGSIDYFSFNFENPLVPEPIAAVVSALYPTTTTNRCADPAYAAIRARFDFNDANGNGSDDDCAAGNIARFNAYIVNGPEVKTDGLDLSGAYVWDDVLGGALTIGADATWVNKYTVAAQSVEGLPVAAAFDAVGLLNYQTVAYPLPQWRGSAYAELNSGPHNLRWTVNYIDSYVDQRTDIFAANVNYGVNGVPVALPQGKSIGSWTTSNVAYRFEGPSDTVFTVAVDNVFDVDPPFVRLNLNYDPFTANGLGRTIRVGARKSF